MSVQVREPTKADALTRQLWHIAGTGDVDRLEELLAEGAEVNAADTTGVTALMRAAYHGQSPMVRALIEHGADPDSRDRGGLTALSMAKHAGHQEIVEALASAGAQFAAAQTRTARVVGAVTEDNIDDGDDDGDVTPSPTTHVRTLHEPPDIWDLVHTTVPDSDPPAQVVRGSGFVKPLIFGAVLIIGIAIALGWFYLRGSGSSVSHVEPLAETAATKPSAPTRPARPAAANRQDESRRIAPASDDQSKLPLMKVTSERAQVHPVASAVALSAKKPAAKTQSKTAKILSPMFGAETGKAGAPPRSAGRTEPSASLKKDAAKAQPPPTDSPKPTVAPKPKVIQWP